MDFPRGVKVDRVIMMIKLDPPPRPLCYDTKEAWQEWLMYAHTSGEKLTRRKTVDTPHGPKTIPVWKKVNHCIDCEIGGSFQAKMASDGRCQPYDARPETRGRKWIGHQKMESMTITVPPAVKDKCREKGLAWVRKILEKAE